jgi:hypothetical protein
MVLMTWRHSLELRRKSKVAQWQGLLFHSFRQYMIEYCYSIAIDLPSCLNTLTSVMAVALEN